jgi:hypothetical protein
MKAKTGSSKGTEIRYKPVDETTYPVQLVYGEFYYWRFWCRPNFIVYEKYRNNVKLGYLILPDEKELFRFDQMLAYVETIKTTENLCVRK